jgi:hypothetical protein
MLDSTQSKTDDTSPVKSIEPVPVDSEFSDVIPF